MLGFKRGLLVVFLASLLVSCTPPESSTTQVEQQTPQKVFTEAAQTANVLRLLNLTRTPRPSDTPTMLIPTATKLPPIPTATLPLTVTQIATLTALSLATSAPVATLDRAEFVKDVSVPDGTVFDAGETFVKTWRLQNTGDTTWNTEYQVVFIDGDLMDGPFKVNLPKNVSPGQNIDVSIDFAAPAVAGRYRGYWKLQNADGNIFGLGSDGAEAFWVDIVVESTSAASDLTPTLDVAVAAVSLEVDIDTYTGVCPHTYVFTAWFDLNKPATLTYNLEADNDGGFDFKLPFPATRNLQAGQFSTRFELSFAQSLKGWVRLRVTSPQEMTSNRVNFELICQ